MTYNHQNVGYISLLNNTNGLTYSQPNWAWWRGDAPTASTHATGSNTVRANGDVTRVYDFTDNNRVLYNNGDVEGNGDLPLKWIANWRNGLSVASASTSGYLLATASLTIPSISDMTIIAAGATTYIYIWSSNTSQRRDMILWNGAFQNLITNVGTNSATQSSAYGFTNSGITIMSGTSSINVGTPRSDYRYNGYKPFAIDQSTNPITATNLLKLNGLLMEVMIWDRILSLNEILDVENYLKQKWNISY